MEGSFPLVERRRGAALLRGAPYVLLLMMSTLAAVAGWYVMSMGNARLREAAMAKAMTTRDEIRLGLISQLDVVLAAAALLTANNEINGAEFRAFVTALRLRAQYPALAGIGYAARVPRRNVPETLRVLELDGTPLKIWPSGPRPAYYPVIFLEPGDQRNATAVGFDLSTDHGVRAAFERARDTGLPAVAVAPPEPFRSAREKTFLFLVPIFQRRVPLDTVDQRRRALVGFVFSPFNAQGLLDIVAARNPEVSFEVYDGEPSNRSTPLYRSIVGPALDGYALAETIVVAGQRWLTVVRSVPGARPSAKDAAGVVSVGVLLAFMLFVITRAQVRAWDAAAEHEAQLQRVALHDPLTSLPNRALLDDRLAKAIADVERHGRRLALLFLDVDRFKQINDSWGHAIGDELLRSVAGRLSGCVRESDTVCRHGGDEFVILLTGIDQAQHAAQRAQEIIKVLTTPHRVRGHTIDLTVSVGVSVCPEDGHDAEALLQAADAAMYQAKEHGRNVYRFSTAEMNARAARRQAVEGGLRRALEREELLLHYQPKIALATGAITGVEALVRWRDPQRGLIGPAEFVPTAEESGLIVAMGRWVLHEACRQARRWRDAGLPTTVAVNVSPVELRANDFLEQVAAVLQETGLDPHFLELELTERVLVQGSPSTLELLQALKAYGLTITLDDFGTGYSSVSYLRQFPIDVLKVDQAFIREIATVPDGAPIVSAMIGIGRSFRHRVIAEGVETAEQCAFLRAQRCSEGQGFFFSQPLAAEEFTSFAEARSTVPRTHWAG